VQGQPGFLGYLVAEPASEGQHEFIFASIWADSDAVKARFGEQWRVSLLPPGYAELIEECSVDHYHLTGQSLAGHYSALACVLEPCNRYVARDAIGRRS
jgi:hypothetical protein